MNHLKIVKGSTFNPVMMTLARDLRRMTNDDLAQITGLPIADFEHYRAIPSDEQIQVLSDVLDFPAAFFARRGQRYKPIGWPENE